MTCDLDPDLCHYIDLDQKLKSMDIVKMIFGI